MRPSCLLLPLCLVVVPYGCSEQGSSRSGEPPREAGADAASPGGRTAAGGAAASGGAPAGGASTGGTPGSGGSDDAGPEPEDGGAPDGGDGGDAAPPYCPLADFVPMACGDDAACPEEQECLRGVCLRTCGTALDDLASILGDAVTPVATICNARGAVFTTRAHQDGDCTRVDVISYRIFGSGIPDEVGWSFRTYEVDPFRASPAPGTTTTGAFTSPGGSPFFQSWLSLSPSGDVLGSFLYYDAGTPNPMVVSADGSGVTVGPSFARPSSYYGHDWLDDDRWIVAESGAGARVVALDPAPGGAAVPLLTGLGDTGGTVRVLHRAGVVLAGAGDNLYVVPLARVLAVADGSAPSPIDVTTDADVQHVTGALLGSFQLIGETALATTAGGFGDPLEVRRLEWSGTTLSLGAPRTLLENAQAFEGYSALTGDLVYLPHFSRALIARWAP